MLLLAIIHSNSSLQPLFQWEWSKFSVLLRFYRCTVEFYKNLEVGDKFDTEEETESNPRNKISKMCFQIWWICSHSAIFNLSDLQVTRQYFFFLLYCMFHSASCIAIDVRFCLQYIEASLKKTNCSIVLDFWWLLLLEWLLGYFWTILFSQKSLF